MSEIIKIETFTGERLLERETNVEALIDGFLWERDVVMLLGSEKSGKSIIGMQMLSALSAGGLFLGKYQAKKVPVLYLQCEGKKDETPLRLENMMKGVSLDKDYFIRMYKKFLPLDMDVYMHELSAEISKLPIKPKVMCLDCLYMAMSGDLNENEDVRRFIQKLSIILELHKMTCIIVHHAKKEEYFEGKEVEKGDKCSYGSVFLRANVDHILFFNMNKDKTRTLSCSTQRSGKVAENETLVLVEPSPLMFQIQGAYTGSEETVLWHCTKARVTKAELIKNLGYSESTIDRALKTLIYSNKINIVDELKSVHGSPQKVYGVLNGHDYPAPL